MKASFPSLCLKWIVKVEGEDKDTKSVFVLMLIEIALFMYCIPSMRNKNNIEINM